MSRVFNMAAAAGLAALTAGAALAQQPYRMDPNAPLKFEADEADYVATSRYFGYLQSPDLHLNLAGARRDCAGPHARPHPATHGLPSACPRRLRQRHQPLGGQGRGVLRHTRPEGPGRRGGL